MRLMSEQEVADLLRIPATTLRRWRCVGEPDQPRYIKVGRRVRYDDRDVAEYIDRHRVDPRARFEAATR